MNLSYSPVSSLASTARLGPVPGFDAPTNLLLDALPQAEFRRLQPHLTPIPLSVGQFLRAGGEPVPRVYFLRRGMVSYRLSTPDETRNQMGLVGPEGVVDTADVILGGGPAFIQARVEISGSAVWIPASILREELQQGGALRGLLEPYVQGLLAHATKTASCNRLHTVQERLTSWLLLIGDRVQADDFEVGEELLARLLEVHGKVAHVGLDLLQQSGWIHISRSQITLLNRKALSAHTCECYPPVLPLA